MCRAHQHREAARLVEGDRLHLLPQGHTALRPRVDRQGRRPRTGDQRLSVRRLKAPLIFISRGTEIDASGAADFADWAQRLAGNSRTTIIGASAAVILGVGAVLLVTIRSSP